VELTLRRQFGLILAATVSSHASFFFQPTTSMTYKLVLHLGLLSQGNIQPELAKTGRSDSVQLERWGSDYGLVAARRQTARCDCLQAVRISEWNLNRLPLEYLYWETQFLKQS
jgi:hypothetical protein